MTKDSPKLPKKANKNQTNPDWTEDRFFIGLEGRRELENLKKPKRFVPNYTESNNEIASYLAMTAQAIRSKSE